MDFIGTKAMVIGVGILITLGITTAILVTFNQVTQIYQTVYKTDVGIKKEFHEFTMYQDTHMSGLQMYNTVKKFKSDDAVKIYLNGAILNKDEYINSFDLTKEKYSSKKYFVSYEDNGNDTYKINFK